MSDSPHACGCRCPQCCARFYDTEPCPPPPPSENAERFARIERALADLTDAVMAGREETGEVLGLLTKHVEADGDLRRRVEVLEAAQ